MIEALTSGGLIHFQRENNMTWAPWITEEIFEKSQDLLVFYYKTYIFYPELLQMAVGECLD